MKNIKYLAFLSVLGLATTSFSVVPTAHASASYRIETFENVDVDKSGLLSDGEYKTYAWGKADWDNDGYLEETEYAQYTDVYYDTYDLEYDTYTSYDTDGDGFIDRTEFNEIPTDPLYRAWDYNNDKQVSANDWDKVRVQYIDRE